MQLKYPTDFFSSDCLTFSLSKPKKKKKAILWYRKRKEKKKKKNLQSSGESYYRPSPSPARLRQPISTVIQRKGRRKKKGLQSSGESCNQTFVPEVLRYEDRDWPLGSPPICSVFSFRKWGFCWEIHLGIIYDSGILV